MKRINETYLTKLSFWMLQNAYGKANAKKAKEVLEATRDFGAPRTKAGVAYYLRLLPRIGFDASKSAGGYFIIASRAEAVDIVCALRMRAEAMNNRADDIATAYGIR